MKLLEKVWPEWRIEGVLGEGSFGKVYKIKREDIGGTYYAALKVISIPKDKSEIQSIMTEGMMDQASATHYFQGMVEEIVKEFAMMEKLKGNTNIVTYEDHKVITHEDSLGWDILIRMELLTPLTDYMANHILGEKDALKLGIDICRALELCQRYHIIHRDIKPENIFVSEIGDYKLGDFGVARTAEKTMSGMSKKGTYTYMAPEVYKGEAYNATVDMYSLGIVLYRLLNNYRTPFLPPAPRMISFSDKETAQARRMNGEEFPAPAQGSEAFTAIIRKACSYHPKDRYADAAQMRLELEELQREASGAATKTDADREASEKTATVSQAAPEAATGHFVAPGEEEDGTGANTGNSVPQEDKTVSMYGIPQEDKTVSMQSMKPVEEPVQTEKHSAADKKKTGLFVGNVVAAVALAACIFLVIVKPFGSFGQDNQGSDNLTNVDNQKNSAINDVNYEDGEDIHILATKLTTDAEGQMCVPEGAESMAHNNRVFHPVSMLGWWVPETDDYTIYEADGYGISDSPDFHPALGSRVTLGEGENMVELECLPISFNMHAIFPNDIYDGNIDIEDANISGMYAIEAKFMENPSDENKIAKDIKLNGFFDTLEDTLAIGIMTASDSGNINLEEFHYTISWTGWKLTLTYGEYSMTYVPLSLRVENPSPWYISGSYIDGYEMLDDYGGLADGIKYLFNPKESTTNAKLKYYDPELYLQNATITANEDGTMIIDCIGDIPENNFRMDVNYRLSENAITFINRDATNIYSNFSRPERKIYASLTGESDKEDITDNMVVNLVDKKYKLVYRLEVALKEAGKEIDMRGLIDTSDVVMDIKTGRVNLNSRILFESDGVTLSQEGKDFLDVFFSVYASCILSEENSGMVSGIEIEGHTDTGGNYDYNLKLSRERADAVADYCLTESNSGLSPEQLAAFGAMTTTVGRSADDPIYNSDGTVNTDASNRVVFRFKLSTDA